LDGIAHVHFTAIGASVNGKTQQSATDISFIILLCFVATFA
jgi:hypothetical protein